MARRSVGVERVDDQGIHESRVALLVVPRDTQRRCLPTERLEQPVGGSPERQAADDGADRHDRRRRHATARPAMPGTARMVPTLRNGLEGATTSRSADAMASSTSGVGEADSAPRYRSAVTASA